MQQKRLLLFVALIGLMIGVGTVTSSYAQGQKATVIAYGDIVTGTITDEAAEVNYRFTGAEGDVIILQVTRYYGADSSAPTLDEPLLILTDPAGHSTQADGYGSAFLALKLPITGDYGVVVSRADPASVGNFQLALYKPETLLPSSPMQATINNEQTQYYWINSTDELRLSYHRTDGTFSPEITIITPGEFGLNTVGAIYGGLVEAGTLDIRIPSDGLYFVRVEESLYDFNFDPVTAEYTLEVVVRKGLPISN
ncbi:MAG: hypothetical protein K8L91_13460 [Anaerolineae bacterium]|nr:hypothetical protein [Anaerolineae bacterium]